MNAPVRYQRLCDDGYAAAPWDVEPGAADIAIAGMLRPRCWFQALRFEMEDESTVTVRPLSPERKALRLARAD
jgi:hypothetical protein